MASIDWYSLSQGQTFTVIAGSTTNFTINAEGNDDRGYYWRIKITSNNSHVKFANSTQTTYSDATPNKTPLTQSISVTGISAGSSVITLQMQWSYDGAEWQDSDVSARTINYTIQSISITYDLKDGTPDPSILKVGDMIVCSYCGAVKSITLNPGIYKLECWGAQGGTYSSSYGGKGGYSVGTITFKNTPRLFYLRTGQQAPSNGTMTGATSGGWNGGGNGYNRQYSGTSTYGQGGGGGSDIRIATDSLYARVIVAGGGGGSASEDAQTSKCGGGTSGSSPVSGYGASQTGAGTNGSFGQGGAATTGGYNYKYGSGGGGGGWYGGGACSNYSDSINYRGYNGGGSGYVYTSSTASSYPSGCLLNSEYYLANAQTIAGNTSFPNTAGTGNETGHTGNGYTKITVIQIGFIPFKANVENAWKTIKSCQVNTGSNPVSLTNIVNPSSFSLSNVTVADGVYTFASGTTAMITQSITTPTADHKYYGRVMQKCVEGSSYPDGRFEIWVNDASGGFMTFASAQACIKDNEWHPISRILSLSSITSGSWVMRSFTVSGTSPFYRKEMMIIDLTASFGEGNEPTVEWCDENIPYFTGTKTIGGWKEVKKFYTKIYGQWIEMH